MRVSSSSPLSSVLKGCKWVFCPTVIVRFALKMAGQASEATPQAADFAVLDIRGDATNTERLANCILTGNHVIPDVGSLV